MDAGGLESAWDTLECPRCGRRPHWWIWRAVGMASTFRPVRVCPWCKQVVEK